MCHLVMDPTKQVPKRLQAMFKVNAVVPIDTCTCTIIELIGRGDMSSIRYQGPVHLGYVMDRWDQFCPVHGATPEESKVMFKWARCEFHVPISGPYGAFLEEGTL